MQGLARFEGGLDYLSGMCLCIGVLAPCISRYHSLPPSMNVGQLKTCGCCRGTGWFHSRPVSKSSRWDVVLICVCFLVLQLHRSSGQRWVPRAVKRLSLRKHPTPTTTGMSSMHQREPKTKPAPTLMPLPRP